MISQVQLIELEADAREQASGRHGIDFDFDQPWKKLRELRPMEFAARDVLGRRVNSELGHSAD